MQCSRISSKKFKNFFISKSHAIYPNCDVLKSIKNFLNFCNVLEFFPKILKFLYLKITCYLSILWYSQVHQNFFKLLQCSRISSKNSKISLPQNHMLFIQTIIFSSPIEIWFQNFCNILERNFFEKFQRSLIEFLYLYIPLKSAAIQN